MHVDDIEPAPTNWVRFYFSLGLMYNQQPHPRLRATGNDLVFIDVNGMEVGEPGEQARRARQKFQDLLGPGYERRWAFQYTYEEVIEAAEYFPGECVPVEAVLWEDLPGEQP